MNKNYNIVHSSQPTTSNNINVNIEAIDTIFDCSADSIFCACLELVDDKAMSDSITKILNKLKPGGFVTFSIKNMKNICSSFISGIISGNDLLKHTHNLKSIVVTESIYTSIDIDKYKLVQLSQNDDIIAMTVERQKV